MKGWATNHALTLGVCEVEVQEFAAEDKYVYTTDMWPKQYIRKRTFFETKAEAIANAKQQARRKIASLEKQLAAMRKLAEEPKVRTRYG